MNKPFWQTKTLAQMNSDEWERLCDGCGLCCLVKIEDEDTGEIFNTCISCRQLNTDNCQCIDYKNRFKKVDACTQVTPDNISQLTWLPASCAYKRLANNKKLLSWHPLISHNQQSVHLMGISAKHFAQSEQYIHPEQLPSCIINLPTE